MDVRMRLGMSSVTETIGDACREVGQLAEIVDYNESLSFASHDGSVQ